MIGRTRIGVLGKGLGSYGNARPGVEKGMHEPSEHQPRVHLGTYRVYPFQGAAGCLKIHSRWFQWKEVERRSWSGHHRQLSISRWTVDDHECF